MLNKEEIPVSRQRKAPKFKQKKKWERCERFPKFAQWQKSINQYGSWFHQFPEDVQLQIYNRLQYESYRFFKMGLRKKGYFVRTLSEHGTSSFYLGWESHPTSNSKIDRFTYALRAIEEEFKKLYKIEFKNSFCNTSNGEYFEYAKAVVSDSLNIDATSLKVAFIASKALKDEELKIFQTVCYYVVEAGEKASTAKQKTMTKLKIKKSTFHTKWANLSNKIITVLENWDSFLTAA